MNLKRCFRSLLAGSLHGATVVVAAMLVVLTVVGVHMTCSVHVTEQTHGAEQAHGGYGHSGAHQRSSGEALAVHGVATVQADVVEPVVGGSPACSDHDAVTVRSDPLLLPSRVLATTPERIAIRLTPAVVHLDHRTASGLVAAAAPSLRALGINRT
jgi:hypothetical protein